MTGPRLIHVPAYDLWAVLADNGFQDWYTEYGLSALTSVSSFTIAE